MTVDTQLVEKNIKSIVSKQSVNIARVKAYILQTSKDVRNSRLNVALEKGKAECDVTKLEITEYLLRHIDTCQIAQEAPDVASAGWKIISEGVASFNYYCIIPASIVNGLPDEVAATVVYLSGYLTIGHWLHELVKHRIRQMDE